MEDVKEALKLSEMLDEIKKNHSIKPGSPEMEAFLSAGYPKVKTREHANEIIDGWKKDHSLYPYELKEDAIAYLAALDADYKPKADKSPGRPVASRV